MSRKLPRLILCLLVLLVGGCQISLPVKSQGSWRLYSEEDGLLSSRVNAVTSDDRGNVWFATDQGVSVLSPQDTWTHYQAADGLTADYAWDVLVDQHGRVWVATKGGISRLEGDNWQTVTPANSNLPAEFPLGLAVNAQDQVWVLSSVTGLSMVHADDTISYVGTPFSEPSRAHIITLDAQGHVWLATLKGLLAAYDPAEQQWSSVVDVDDPLPQYGARSIYGIAVDRQSGHLWLAADGVVEMDGTTWRLHFPEYRATGVFVDAAGYKWFTVVRIDGDRPSSGLLVMAPDNEEWQYYPSDSNLAILVQLAWVNDITRDAQGNFWMATYGGAVRFTPDR